MQNEIRRGLLETSRRPDRRRLDTFLCAEKGPEMKQLEAMFMKGPLARTRWFSDTGKQYRKFTKLGGRASKRGFNVSYRIHTKTRTESKRGPWLPLFWKW